MANIIGKPSISLTLTLEIAEDEARALEAMAGYGEDDFIRAFYEKLGTSYMRDHEAGLRKFLASVRELMPMILAKADQARQVFSPSTPGA